jgi:hypothetical protein
MRNLFLVLVLLNLAFAAWQNWYAEPERPVRRSVEPGAPGITLLDEAARQTQAATRSPRPSADSGPERSVESAPELCANIGPFADAAASGAAADSLGRAGYDVEARSAPGDVWVGRWVYVDGLTTRGDADGAVSALADAGIPDTFVISDSEGGYLVSLGIFSEEARAEQLARQATELGFTPTIADRTRAGEAFWLDVKSADGSISALEAVGPFGRGVRITPTQCDSN